MTRETLEILFKLFLACILSGMIGLERESINRPAGFRTHILVGVGATIVMITNMMLVDIMETSVQPGRFGAAVISGIGFLGAGTIIRDGSVVKGLTTAASLWITACIGLALGSGLYTLAISGTGFVYLTLVFFPKIEKRVASFRNLSNIKITAINEIGQLSKITSKLSALKINIHSLRTLESEDEGKVSMLLNIKCPSTMTENTIVESLVHISGVEEIVVDAEIR